MKYLFGLVPHPLASTKPIVKEVDEMEWQFVVALIIAIPIILFPAAFIWYMNAGGIYAALKAARERRAARARKTREAIETAQHTQSQG